MRKSLTFAGRTLELGALAPLLLTAAPAFAQTATATTTNTGGGASALVNGSLMLGSLVLFGLGLLFLQAARL